MSLKKKTFSEEEILIYDEAVIYKRGDIWQFRYWLVKERRYVRLSLKTRNQVSAIETAKKHFVKIKSETDSGKTYYSKTAKDGVLMYLEYRKGHIDSRTTKSIVKGRYGTIRAHLEHWLDFIERDTKLKELDRDSCADYAKAREKPSATKTTALSTIGETSALRIEDAVDCDGNVKREILLKSAITKGNVARTIYVSDKLHKELDAYIKTLDITDRKCKLFYSQKKTSDGFSPNTLTQYWHYLFTACGIDNASSHSMRRSFATQISSKGVGIRVLQKLMGHKSAQTTMVYIDASDDMMRKAVELV